MDKKEFYSLTDSLKNETALQSEVVSLTELSEALKAKASELEAALGLRLTDAPVDGKAYLRQDGAWVEVSEEDFNGAQLAIPVGTLAYWPLSTPPAGWLEADGSAIDQALYPDLYDVFGANLPDLRGEFIRGWDHGRGVDSSRVLGSSQGDAIRNIIGHVGHTVSREKPSEAGALFWEIKEHDSRWVYEATSNDAGANIGFDASRVVPTADENRPRNIAWMPIIKAFAAPTNQGAIDLTTLANYANTIDDKVSGISNPNLLINGDFSVWQRGTSFSDYSQLTADRWYAWNLGAGDTVSRSTEVPAGFKYSIHCPAYASGYDWNIQQRIELPLIGLAVGEQYTMSYWVKTTATECVVVPQYRGGTTDLDAGAASLVAVPDNGWHRLTHTITITTEPTDHSYLSLQIAGYVNNAAVPTDMYFTGAKLEVGPYATPFIPDDPATNLVKCQRYYANVHRQQWSTKYTFEDYMQFYDSFPVTMRTVPTVVFDYHANYEPNYVNVSEFGFVIHFYLASMFAMDGFTADAEL